MSPTGVLVTSEGTLEAILAHFLTIYGRKQQETAGNSRKQQETAGNSKHVRRTVYKWILSYNIDL
jgi:hypothetical protein